MLYTAANFMKALKQRKEYLNAETKELWEQYAEAFPDEAIRNDRLEGVNAQLEVTGREYQPTSIHQPETAQTTAA